MERSRFSRLRENERLRREANREIEREAQEETDDHDERDVELEFFCACGRADCREKLLLTLAEYEAVHAVPGRRFIVAPGHVTPAVEQVVEEHPGFLVVEKLPAEPH